MAQRARLHTANVTATRLAVRAVELACEATGTAAVARTHILARCRRDAEALRSHLAVNGASVEHDARTRFGLPSIDHLV
jgi:alkylation response protein AidB-like acyl-CoA dehydrogenase